MIARVGVLARDIKLSHTVFALPFALLAMVLAAGWAGRWPRLGEAGLILWCMVSARTFAMGVNRLADAELDAANPRTAGRALPSCRLGRGFVMGSIVVAALLLLAGAAGFWVFYENPWPAWLALPTLGLLAFYSYTKRFTWLCHLVLGLALGVSPLAAAVAIEPGYLAASPVVWLLAGAVLCWVGGFDVIYALQDVNHDRGAALQSMPARLGSERALWVSRVLHLTCLLLFGAAWWASPRLGVGFGLALLAVAGLLVLEHALVWRSETRRLDVAFLTVNGVISLMLGAAGVVDVVS